MYTIHIDIIILNKNTPNRYTGIVGTVSRLGIYLFVNDHRFTVAQITVATIEVISNCK